MRCYTQTATAFSGDYIQSDLWKKVVFGDTLAPGILHGLGGSAPTPVMITNKFRGMVNKNTVAPVIDSGAIVFGKTNSKIMLPKHFPRSVDPFRRPTTKS